MKAPYRGAPRRCQHLFPTITLVGALWSWRCSCGAAGAGNVLPFDDRFMADLRSGRKTVTVRSRRYGEPGEVRMTIVGPVRLLHVQQATRGFAEDCLLDKMGFRGPSDYEAWLKSRPGGPRLRSDRVMIHVFRRAVA